MQTDRTQDRPNSQQRIPQRREDPLPFRVPQKKPAAPSLKGLFRHSRDFQQGAGFHGGSSRRRKGWKLAVWSWLGAFIDGLILIAITALFAMAFSSLVKIPLASLPFVFIEIFLLCCWIYMITLRTFTGASIGEWACDLRLGQPHERMSSFYALRVIGRATLIMASGFVLFPILSFLFRRDLAGSLTGLKIFSLK